MIPELSNNNVVSETHIYMERPDYHINKIKRRYAKLKIFLLYYFLVILGNMIITLIFQKLFWHALHILTMITILGFCSYGYYKVQSGFNIIDSRVLRQSRTLFYFNIISIFVYTINTLYIIIIKILFNLREILSISEKNSIEYGIGIFFFMIYLTLNFLIPILIFIKLSRILHTMEKLEVENQNEYLGASGIKIKTLPPKAEIDESRKSTTDSQ